MSTPANLSYDWVREIQPELKELDSIPLTGAPPFPWEDFSSHLSAAFDKGDLKVAPGETTWRTKDKLYEGLGDSPYPLVFAIPSLRGQVCWVMPAQEIDVLAALLLTKETHPLTFHDTDLNESFYRFLALETLYQLTQVSFDHTLTPLLTSLTTLPKEDSLCKDISLSLQGQTLWGRLIISPEFRISWAEHFAKKQEPSLSSQMAQLIDLTIHLEAGKIFLNIQQWKEAQVGDFILLDSCTLEPSNWEGRVLLTVNGRQAFRAKLKEGTLKILESPLFHEVDTPMAKESEHEDEESDFDQDSKEESLFDDDETLNLLKEDDEEEETSPPQVSVKETQKPIQPDQIPLNLIVEVGQIQMSVDKLMKLEPGNLLEIDIHPENGVNLTINGKVVGKGELIRIGEAIGVRILELGR